ncbi:hypothetical protein [Amycolatopsis sp. cmx-11-12]|uniref:hypothetical protein n=1 Tax=Amycolatopsis sp. cmx-11-12 TaxID=2785795 RepID=UPI003917F304
MKASVLVAMLQVVALSAAVPPQASSKPMEGCAPTPFGLAPQAEVVEITNSETVRVIDGRLQRLDLHTGEKRGDLGPVGPGGPRDLVAPAASMSSRCGDPELDGEAAMDHSQKNIQQFSTTWTVPSPPIDRDCGWSKKSMPFSIWNAVTGGNDGILQPVLGWCWFNEPKYTLANWGEIGGKYVHGKIVEVAPGTSVTGVIDFMGKNKDGYAYRVSFVGYPDADLTYTRPSAAEGIMEYIEKRDFPGPDTTLPAEGEHVAFTDIKLTLQPCHEAPKVINWTTNNTSYPKYPTNSGYNTLIVDDSSTHGHVEIYYR